MLNDSLHSCLVVHGLIPTTGQRSYVKSQCTIHWFSSSFCMYMIGDNCVDTELFIYLFGHRHNVTSRKHAHIILTPLNPSFI